MIKHWLLYRNGDLGQQRPGSEWMHFETSNPIDRASVLLQSLTASPQGWGEHTEGRTRVCVLWGQWGGSTRSYK